MISKNYSWPKELHYPEKKNNFRPGRSDSPDIFGKLLQEISLYSLMKLPRAKPLKKAEQKVRR